MALTCTLFSSANVFAQKPACESLSTDKNTNITIDRSGTYCLASDLKIKDRRNLPDAHTQLPADALIITSSNVVLDLRGHTIKTGNATKGISIGLREYYSEDSDGKSAQPTNISIRNGNLQTKISSAIRSGFKTVSIRSDIGYGSEGLSTVGKSKEEVKKSADYFDGERDKMFQRILLSRPPTPAHYVERNIRIENMHINARGPANNLSAQAGAINIEGANTAIRDCVIEADAGTAIWIFGPNAVIENNTIIVHGAAPLREADAPIRLHQADGAVIRNNKFFIKDNANHRAISVFATGAFTIENNTFYGMTEKDEVAKAFTGKLVSTETGSRFEPAWKAALSIH